MQHPRLDACNLTGGEMAVKQEVPSFGLLDRQSRSPAESLDSARLERPRGEELRLKTAYHRRARGYARRNAGFIVTICPPLGGFGGSDKPT
jgi:hypothetical protein